MMLADDGCSNYKSGSDIPSGYSLIGDRLCPPSKGPSTSISVKTVEVNGKMVSSDQVNNSDFKFDSKGNRITDKKDCFPFCPSSG